MTRRVGLGRPGVEDERAATQPHVEGLEAQRLDLRDPPADERRAGLVDRPHPGEVRRKSRLAVEQRPGERVDLERQERVVAPLVADRRGRRGRDPGRAQRARAVGRVDTHEILVGQQDVVERVVHRVGVRDGVGGTQQVRPPDRADQQRPAGQERDRLACPARVGQLVGHVLRGVARCVERGEAQLAHVERVAVVDRPVLVLELGPGPDDVLGAGQGGQVAGARDVVVVEVRLDDVGDAQLVARGIGQVDVDVAARIHDDREPRCLVGDEGREVSEPFDAVAGDLHARSLHRRRDTQPGPDRGGRRGLAAHGPADVHEPPDETRGWSRARSGRRPTTGCPRARPGHGRPSRWPAGSSRTGSDRSRLPPRSHRAGRRSTARARLSGVAARRPERAEQEVDVDRVTEQALRPQVRRVVEHPEVEDLPLRDDRPGRASRWPDP